MKFVQLILILWKKYYSFRFNLQRMINTQYDFAYKVVIVGSYFVGKSSIFLRYVDDNFHELPYSPCGIEFKKKVIEHQGSLVKLQIWDSVGHQRYRGFGAHHTRGLQGIVLIFDLSSKKTFLNLSFWKREIQQKNIKGIPIMLVGNKCDLHGERQVSRQEAEAFASNEGMLYLESSAKTGQNVDLIFNKLTGQMKNHFNPQIPSVKLALKDNRQIKAKCW